MAVAPIKAYVAFLRGVNVGGHNAVKMSDLKAAFESLGFQKVRTVLASGNVLFYANSSSTNALARTIEAHLKESLDRDCSVIVRSVVDLQKIADSDPFKKLKLAAGAKLFITLFGTKPSVKVPDRSAVPRDYTMVRQTESEILFMLSPSVQTTDVMAALEKRFGRDITTRNWNTFTKILATASR